jgi:drug/metabolite transporter, DME family
MPKTASVPVPARAGSFPVRRGLAFLAVAGTAWGTTGAAVDVVYRSSDFGPMALSFWRFAGGFVLLLAARRFVPARRAAAARPVLPRALVLVGTGLGLAVFQTAYFAAVRDTGLAVGTIVTLGACPLFTAAGGRAFLGERVGRGGAAAVSCALLGLGILVLGNQQGQVRPDGVAAALLSAAGYAVAALLGRWTGRHGTGEEPYSLTLWSFGIGAAAMLPLAWREGLVPGAAHPLLVAAMLGWVTVFTTAVAYPLYFAGAAVVRAATAAVVMLIEPVSAAALAVTLLGERLTVVTIAGTAVMLTAIAGLSAAESRRPAG